MLTHERWTWMQKYIVVAYLKVTSLGHELFREHKWPQGRDLLPRPMKHEVPVPTSTATFGSAYSVIQITD
jgi:hypothetical protein